MSLLFSDRDVAGLYTRLEHLRQTFGRCPTPVRAPRRPLVRILFNNGKKPDEPFITAQSLWGHHGRRDGGGGLCIPT